MENRCKGGLEKTHGRRPRDIPAEPGQVYGGQGWAGFGDWLGTGNVHPKDREYRPFLDAREFARGLGLSGQGQWRAYAKGELEEMHGIKPEDIPAAPEPIYRVQGWVSWGDWLGTGTVHPKNREYRPFLKAREFVQGLQLANREQWQAYAKGTLNETHGPKPEDIPAAPWQVYRDKGWPGMGDWLGTGNLAPKGREYRPFRDAREFVQALKLSGQGQWVAYAKGALEATHGVKPEDIPADPRSVYVGQSWAGMGDWLGTGIVAPQDRKYRSFLKAREFVRGLKLACSTQWKAYAKRALEETHGLKPKDIPANPWQIYRDKGWAGMGDWLGTGNVHPKDREYRSFLKAREFVRGLKLAGQDPWRAYAKGALEKTHGLKPKDIPTAPDRVYQDRGWGDWGDWFGTGNVHPKDREYRSFREAKAFAQALELDSAKQWKAYAKGALEETHGLKPEDIPADPRSAYADRGWAGMGDWLGTGNVPGGQAKRR